MKKGLPFTGKVFRQIKVGNYGRFDLATIERPNFITDFKSGCITIYELKQYKIGISAFLQAIQYVKGIQVYLRERDLFNDFTLKIVLVGKNIDNESSFIYLPSFLKNNDFKLELYTYDFTIDGFKFTKHENYELTNSGFRNE